MRLIFGLGNPGKNYYGTRHNVGFDTLNTMAEKQAATFVKKDRFKAEVAEVNLNGERVLLVKPLTFYNLVGESYRAVCDFYKLQPEDTLIVHDELALPFGTVRVREGGSDAGNNGVKSINLHGGEYSMRLRVGVANEQHQLIGDTDFVLTKFNLDDSKRFRADIMPTLLGLLNDFAAGTLDATSHRHDN